MQYVLHLIMNKNIVKLSLFLVVALTHLNFFTHYFSPDRLKGGLHERMWMCLQ